MQNEKITPFYYDYPSDKDLLKRDAFVHELVDKLRTSNAQNEGAFSVLIDEMYGMGKSTFMKQIQQYASSCSLNIAWFKPWLYNDNNKMTESLLNIIANNSDPSIYSLKSKLLEYLNLITSIKNIHLSHIHRTSAEEKFDEISIEMMKRESPLIILVDDVDRLTQKELLNFLQLIRNTANFSQLCYIVAGDKQAICQMLINEGITNPSIYLKKFFNYEVSFPKDDGYVYKILEEEITNVLTGVGLSDSVNSAKYYLNTISSLQEILPTVRDTYRFLNTLSFGLDVLKKNKILSEIVIDDFIGLSLIKYAFPKFYKILRDYDNLVLDFSQNKRLVLKSDYENAFSTRTELKEQKKLFESMGIESSIKINSIPEGITYDDLVLWLKPTSLEMLSGVLRTLFSSNEGQNVNSICYGMEFFKYFALNNKNCDITNAEMVSVMSTSDMADFRTLAQQIIRSNRRESFLHKLYWFVKTQSYQRISILKKILLINTIENTKEHRSAGWTEISYFQTNFYGIIQQIFVVKNSQDKDNSQKSNNELIKWCEEEKNYKNVVLTLCALHENYQYRNNVFSNDGFNNLCKTAFTSFVDNAFSKKPYDADNCEVLELYQDNLGSFCSARNAILETIKTFSKPETFLFFVLLYDDNQLKWNQHFIRIILNNFHEIENQRVFGIEIPSDWMNDLNIRMLDYDPNKLIDDEQHPFIQAALEWWKQQSN